MANILLASGAPEMDFKQIHEKTKAVNKAIGEAAREGDAVKFEAARKAKQEHHQGILNEHIQHIDALGEETQHLNKKVRDIEDEIQKGVKEKNDPYVNYLQQEKLVNHRKIKSAKGLSDFHRNQAHNQREQVAMPKDPGLKMDAYKKYGLN